MAHAAYFPIISFHQTTCKIALTTLCLLTLHMSANAQSMTGSRLCRAYEQELQNINETILLNNRQAVRYQQLAQMQQQARRDATRFGCNAGPFSNGSNSETCRYINHAQQRLDSAMNVIGTQAATAQQRRMRQAIYKDMQYYNCRSPQVLARLIQENRDSARQPARKRIKQTYKKPQPVRQAALQKPVLLIPAQETEPQSDIMPVKTNRSIGASVGKSVFSIPAEPAMHHTKAAENPPPPVSKAVDYVPDPKIRRVGPAYFPAQ